MQPAPQEEPEQEDGFAYSLYYWLQTLTAAVVAIVLLFTFVGRITRVIGDSMCDTLHEGDLLITYSLGCRPRQGDIVVLNKTTPETAAFLDGESIVKRVIAVAGQQVDIDYYAGAVYVDGQVLDEPYIREAMRTPASFHMQQTSFTVPQGSLFVLGDNRNESTDSRDDRLGMIDERYVLGRAVVILFPFRDFGLL